MSIRIWACRISWSVNQNSLWRNREKLGWLILVMLLNLERWLEVKMEINFGHRLTWSNLAKCLSNCLLKATQAHSQNKPKAQSTSYKTTSLKKFHWFHLVMDRTTRSFASCCWSTSLILTNLSIKYTIGTNSHQPRCTAYSSSTESWRRIWLRKVGLLDNKLIARPAKMRSKIKVSSSL